MASRTRGFERNENDRFDTPPLTFAYGSSVLIRWTASMNDTAYGSCSSMPVPMVRMFGSKMMSSGGKPTCWVRRSYARFAMISRCSTVVAWPVSSNAITTTAAPNWRTIFAWRRNSGSPSLSEIELTTPLPCTHSRPAWITLNFDESIITGIREMSGSAAIRLRNRFIAATPSSMPSSMQTSRMFAPLSTCWRATATASSYLSSLISRRNAAEPVTFVRSPTITKLVSGVIVSGSRPDSRV